MTSGSASSSSRHGTAPPHPLLFPGVIPRHLQVLPILSTLPKPRPAPEPCSRALWPLAAAHLPLQLFHFITQS